MPSRLARAARSVVITGTRELLAVLRILISSSREDLPLGEFYISHHAVCPRGQDWQGKRRGDVDEPTAAQGALDL